VPAPSGLGGTLQNVKSSLLASAPSISNRGSNYVGRAIPARKTAPAPRVASKPAPPPPPPPSSRVSQYKTPVVAPSKRRYKDGGKVPKMAMGGLFSRMEAQIKAAGNNPAPAPSGGGVIARAKQAMQNMPKQPAQPASFAPQKSNYVGRVVNRLQGKPMSLLKNAFGRKEGGEVGNKSLQKINEKQNAPAVKASKADTNLKYPETMNSPQKTPKLKC